MFDVKDLEDVISAMQNPKFPKKVKVTKQFWDYLESESGFKPPEGYISYYMGLPIEIDDEIDGFYEIVY